ncbi:hypothetical protein ACFLSF_01025 [Candidatus Bipolaricaulota bacterium]
MSAVSRTFLGIVVLLLAILMGAILGVPQEVSQEAEPFDVVLDGRKTWTVRYGLGSPLGLASSGLSVGQLTLDQTLIVDVQGEALSILTIEAHFDDRLPEQMQSLTVILDTERLDGVFGDFQATGFESFTAFGRQMKGLRLDYTMGSATLTAVASKLESVAQTRTFVGETAQAEVVFSANSLTDPSVPSAYSRHIDGLYAYPISALYVPEFTDIQVAFDASDKLAGVLSNYGLSYLMDVLKAAPGYALETREFTVAGDPDQVLLLNYDALVLVRDRLVDAIGAYNDEFRPEGAEKREYPFAKGTDYDRVFLEHVAASVAIELDGEIHPLLDADRRRFYRLGRSNVKEGSVTVSISLDGESFRRVGAPLYPDYAFALYSAAGVIELLFPPSFFELDGSVRVSFSYAVTGGAFSLGLGVIPGSERVTLNGTLLARDADYQVDYEVGMVFLLTGIGETDVVQIEYELYSGGLGRTAEYSSYLYGLQLDWEVSDVLSLTGSLLQVAEDPRSIADQEAAATMPNRHTIAALSGRIKLEDLDANFLIGTSDDRFPFDDNARTHAVNEVSSIAATQGSVFFGHRAGLTVFDGSGWKTYGVGNGLGGRRANALVADNDKIYVGTNAGLTVIALDGDDSLERVGNWYRYTENNGLPASGVRALLATGKTLWVGTSTGLASVSIDELGADSLPTFTNIAAVGEVDVTALAGVDETLYVGTTRGVYSYAVAAEDAAVLPGTEADFVNGLLALDGTLYVASDRGLRGYRGEVGVGWLVVGQRVEALGILDGILVYGTSDGLFNAHTGEAIVAGAAITAVGASGDALWIGSRADEAFELTVWRQATDIKSLGSRVTGIDGEDPFGYVDTLESEHTARGAVARASFSHEAEGFSISGMVDTTAPTYRTLGSLHRSDSTGWDLTTSMDLPNDAQLTVVHDYRLVDASTGEPSGRMANSVSFSGAFGPRFSLTAQQESVNEDSLIPGPESSRINYSVTISDSLFTDALGLKLSWSDGYVWAEASDDTRRDTRLGVDADIDVAPNLALRLGWSRPMQVYGETHTGREQFAWRSEWEGETSIADLQIEHDSSWSRGVLEGSGAWEHALGVDVNVASWGWGSWKYTPSVDVNATYEDLAATLGGRMTLLSKTEGWSIQAVVQGDLSGIGKPVLHQSGKLSTTISFSGIEDLSASVTAAVDRGATVYQGVSKASGGLSVTGRLTWAPDTGHYDTMSFSWRSSGEGDARRVTAMLDNSYRLDLMQMENARRSEGAEGAGESEAGLPGYPTIVIQADTAANLFVIGEDVRADGSLTGRLDAAFSQTWSAGVSVSYLVGTSSDKSLYHGLLFEATVAIDF